MLLYNTILTTGIFPDEWGKAIIHTLHKCGDINTPANFRGISLLSVTSKIFTKLLNERLVKWAESEHASYDEQAGFRKGFSTIDQIFNLFIIVEKYLSRKKGRMYAAFIDFSRAFDTIPHVSMFIQLMKRGIHGNVLTILRSMYSKLKASVRTSTGLTDWFECLIGTRQGCMLSPFIFAMYINEFIELLTHSGWRGIQVSDTSANVNVLLYADDMVLCADSIGDLQKQLHVLEQYCNAWGMTVNLKKSKIMVFRNGGIIKNSEKWLYNDMEIEIVSHNKYLGVMFNRSLKWNSSHDTLATQGNKSLVNLYKLDTMCGGMPPETLFKLFDKIVDPVLCYGAEVWGYEKHERIERIHTKFCKRVLGVSYSTSNVAVLGDCGRYPLFISYFTKCINFWLKLLNIDNNRLTKKCYLLSKNLDANGRQTWCSKIRLLLCRYGFNIIWQNQGVGNIRVFMSEFIQRLKDCYLQEWNDNVTNNRKLDVYRNIKITFELEPYINCIRERKHISVLAKFRTSSQ